MDNRTFDGLARMMAEAVPTRRGLLRWLGGGVIAALLARFGVEEVAARCVRLGKVCKEQGKKLNCCGGAKCQGAKCKCTGGEIACGGKCVAAECCKHADCGPLKLCANGTCVVGQGTCPSGENICAGSTFNCGSGPGGQSCSCYQTTGNGTRCGNGLSLSQGCLNNDDCAERHPGVSGVFCARLGQPACRSITTCETPCPRSG